MILLGPNFKQAIPPRTKFSWDSGRSLEELPDDWGALSLEVKFTEDNGAVITRSEITYEESEDGGRVSHARMLDSLRIPFTPRQLTVSGVAGMEGRLPRGRLRALINLVTCQEDMDNLCWGVLRRYAVSENRFPNPPRNVRLNAWSAIKQAQRKAKIPQGISLSPPDDFWTKSLPDGRTFWCTTNLVQIRMGGKVLSLQRRRALDELLDPDQCPSDDTGPGQLPDNLSTAH